MYYPYPHIQIFSTGGSGEGGMGMGKSKKVRKEDFTRDDNDINISYPLNWSQDGAYVPVSSGLWCGSNPIKTGENTDINFTRRDCSGGRFICVRYPSNRGRIEKCTYVTHPGWPCNNVQARYCRVNPVDRWVWYFLNSEKKMPLNLKDPVVIFRGYTYTVWWCTNRKQNLILFE